MARTEWPAIARCCVFPFLFAAFLPGCTSSSLKGAKVGLTTSFYYVAECRAVGDVKADPPFVSPNDWKKRLRNQAAALGADNVLYENPPDGSVKGKAYDCGGHYPKPSETMRRMREVAIAVEKYAIDQNAYPNATTMDELIGLLVPRYADVLPTVDAWGTVLSYAVATDHEHYRLMSAGGKRIFQIESLVTPIGSLPPGPQLDSAADIVFEDGVFVQWPDIPH